MVAVAAANLAQVDAANAAPYRAALRALKTHALDVRDRFDIYLDRDARRELGAGSLSARGHGTAVLPACRARGSAGSVPVPPPPLGL